MTTNIAITSVATLTDSQRKAVSILAAAACPETEWPRALALVGIGDIEAAIAPDKRTAVYWVGPGEGAALTTSPALRRTTARQPRTRQRAPARAGTPAAATSGGPCTGGTHRGWGYRPCESTGSDNF